MNWIEEYRRSLKMKEVEEVLDLIFYRPIAFVLVRAVYKTEITPNDLTITAILFGLMAGCFYSMGQPAYFKIGAICYLAFNILDCSDGQLARLKKNGNNIGRIIDGIADYLATLAVYLGIVIGFAFNSDKIYYWLIMTLIAGISTIVHGVLVDYYRTRFLCYVSGRRTSFENDIEEYTKEYESIKYRKGKRLDRMILQIYFKYSSLQRLLVGKKKKTKLFVTTSREYFRKNKIIIRFWVLLGPTTQLTALIICSFINRFDIFIWIIIAVLNSLALILWPIQKIIDKTL